jgi:hypothetical protein
MEVDMPLDAHIDFNMNGVEGTQPIRDLLQGSRSHYSEGFVSHAAVFKRAIPTSEYCGELCYNDPTPSKVGDVYVVKVRQLNNEWAISSPVWIE